MACRENVADGLYPVGKLRDRYISSDNKSRYGREYPKNAPHADGVLKNGMSIMNNAVVNTIEQSAHSVK